MKLFLLLRQDKGAHSIHSQDFLLTDIYSIADQALNEEKVE